MSFTEGQQLAYDAMMSGENVFLTGEAGTGKSYVIQEFLKEKKKDVLVCAPTGIAAINVGGITLHKAFRLPLNVLSRNTRYKVSSAVEAAKIIIIDEISMCKIDLFATISKILSRTKGHKQFIVVGDFFQLPPVITKRDREYLINKWGSSLSEKYTIDDLNEAYAFMSKGWEAFNFHSIILTEQVRQRDDLGFLNALNQIRIGEETGISWIMQHSSPAPKKDAIYLCGRNDVVFAKNIECLDRLKTESKQYIAEIAGDIIESDTLAEKVLRLKKGCRVMALVNDKEGKQYVNGSLGYVKSMENDYVIVDFDNGNKNVIIGKYTWTAKDYKSEEKIVKEYRLQKGRSKKTGLVNLSPWRVAADGENVPVDTMTEDGRALVRTVTRKSFTLIPCGSITQIPLKLAYAVTIHKSQGQTYDSVTLDPYCFAPGQLYVALSRVRRITDLYLERPIEYSDLQTSYAVKEFYRRIQGDDEKELFLPSYAVSHEEMKMFKAWWAKILKQRENAEWNNLVEKFEKEDIESNKADGTHNELFKDDRLNNSGNMNENGHGVPDNHKKAMKGYTKAEVQEDEDTLVGANLIFSYEDDDVSEELEEAMKWYNEDEEQEDEDDLEDANYTFSFENGEESVKPSKNSDKYSSNKKNYNEIIKHYIDLAENGGPAAQRDLGYKFQYGRDVPQDYAEAVKWYRRASQQGYTIAINDLGVMYENGKGVPQDYVEATRLYRKAAEQGEPFAQRNLGYMYENGKGVPQDYAEAVRWYRKSAAQDHSTAINDMGRMYEFGKGVPQDYVEAARLYRKAAEKGNSSAQVNLGCMYELGKGVPKYYPEALEWYRKAAGQGELLAQHKLGCMYKYGKGIPEDYVEAVKWYRKAAEQNYSIAINDLGCMYYDGKGVPQDYVEAVKLFKKAAEQGNIAAQHNMGVVYEYGKGVLQDFTEAMKWYRKAAEQGDSSAQNTLGVMYRDGKGVPQDFTEAMKWYRKAAEQGNDFALADLGYMYEFGKGVERNLTVAESYYVKASELGNNFAKERLKEWANNTRYTIKRRGTESTDKPLDTSDIRYTIRRK